MAIDFLDGSLNIRLGTIRIYYVVCWHIICRKQGIMFPLFTSSSGTTYTTDVTKFAHTSGKFPNESEAFVTDRWKGNHILHRSASGVITRIVDHIGCKYACFVPSCRECQHISNCETIIKEFLRTSVYPGKPTFLLPAHYASIPPSLSHYVWGWCTGTFAHLKTRVWLMNFGWKSEPLSF